MSANFSLKNKMEILLMALRLVISAALIMILTLLVGCASPIFKVQYPEVEGRHSPDIQLGAELILLEKSPKLSTSLIDKEGAAHVFVVDKSSQLNHIEILGDKVITREFLGKIETKQAKFLDAVEHPPGKLRVLAGDKQYFQVAPNGEWQEIKGNRCARFVPVGDDLFCTFVIKGAEIAAPERTDYTFGWFLLVPIVYWSHEHASKLVLAQESSDGWIVRAVVDPDTPMDADGDFMVGTDSLGNIHFLYFTSKGGGTFIVFAYGYSGGARGSSPEPELRCAHLTMDQILSHSIDSQDQPSIKNATSVKWMTVMGAPLPNIPFIKKDSDYKHTLRPLNRNFSVNKATGEVSGLIWAGGSWVELSLHDEKWGPRFNIVTTKGYPASNFQWLDLDHPLIKSDCKGKYHLLLESVERKSVWTSRKHMNYLLKDYDDWSAPLNLGNSHWYSDLISLAVSDSGVVFATWVNEEGKFIGRWIKPPSTDIQ